MSDLPARLEWDSDGTWLVLCAGPWRLSVADIEAHGQPVRVNLAYLVLYAAHGAGSCLLFHDGSETVVQETPEAIDRLVSAVVHALEGP